MFEEYGVRKTIVEQGQKGDTFCIILSGRVSVYVKVLHDITKTIHMVITIIRILNNSETCV